MAPKFEYRDVCGFLQVVRDFLLGRAHTLHNRLKPCLAPRTLPRPELPRAPEYKYSDQYYFNRTAMHSVRPPVVAPLAEGPAPHSVNMSETGKGLHPSEVHFCCAPTPGCTWWWDGHCYYGYESGGPSQSTDVTCTGNKK